MKRRAPNFAKQAGAEEPLYKYVRLLVGLGGGGGSGEVACGGGGVRGGGVGGGEIDACG